MGECLLVGKGVRGGDTVGKKLTYRVELFTANTVWYPPAKILNNSVKVLLFGGGGGCPNSRYNGASSGYFNTASVQIEYSTPYNIIIGTGGNNTNYTGGTTSFGSLLSAAGGNMSKGGTGGQYTGAQFGGGLNGAGGIWGGGGARYSGGTYGGGGSNGGSGGTYGGGGSGLNGTCGKGGAYGGNGGSIDYNSGGSKKWNACVNAENGINTSTWTNVDQVFATADDVISHMPNYVYLRGWGKCGNPGGGGGGFGGNGGIFSAGSSAILCGGGGYGGHGAIGYTGGVYTAGGGGYGGNGGRWGGGGGYGHGADGGSNANCRAGGGYFTPAFHNGGPGYSVYGTGANDWNSSGNDGVCILQYWAYL